MVIYVMRQKKRISLEDLRWLVNRKPWHTEEELRELSGLVVEYQDVKKAFRMFTLNGWVE